MPAAHWYSYPALHFTGFPGVRVVLVSWHCCRKLPQTCWPRTTEIYSLTVQEAKSPELVPMAETRAGSNGWDQGARQALLPLWLHMKNPLLASCSFCCYHSGVGLSASGDSGPAPHINLLLPFCRSSKQHLGTSWVTEGGRLICTPLLPIGSEDGDLACLVVCLLTNHSFSISELYPSEFWYWAPVMVENILL